MSNVKFKMVHENFNVSDMDRALEFYAKALDLHEVRRKTPDDGSYIIVFLRNEHSEFELELTWLADHPEKYDLGEEEFHLAFHVDDFDAAHELHEEMGCEYSLAVKPPFQNAGYRRSRNGVPLSCRFIRYRSA